MPGKRHKFTRLFADARFWHSVLPFWVSSTTDFLPTTNHVPTLLTNIEKFLACAHQLFADNRFVIGISIAENSYLPGRGESVISEADPPGRGPSIALRLG